MDGNQEKIAQSIPAPTTVVRLKALILEGTKDNESGYIEIIHSIFARGEDQLIALRDIIEERQCQDSIYGVSSLRKNMTEEPWLRLVRTAALPNGTGESFRTQMIKIAAIALAAVEAHDGRHHRGDTSPGV